MWNLNPIRAILFLIDDLRIYTCSQIAGLQCVELTIWFPCETIITGVFNEAVS